jgi:hypothetical protein
MGAGLLEACRISMAHVAGSCGAPSRALLGDELTKPGHSQTDAATSPLAPCKNLLERVLDGLWRDAEGAKPGHPRRGGSVGLHEFHLRAA